MIRQCIAYIIVTAILIITPDAGTVDSTKERLFSGVYLTRETETGKMREQIHASFYDTPDGFLLETYKIIDGIEKQMACLIDKETIQIKDLTMVRKQNGTVFERATFNVTSQEVVLTVTGENPITQTFRKEPDVVYSLPDTMHTLLGLRQMKKDEQQKVCVIGWSGNSLMFRAVGQGTVSVDGHAYRVIDFQPKFPLGLNKVVRWNNVFCFVDHAPHYMVMFKGQFGPFKENVVMWLKGADQLTRLTAIADQM